MGSEMIKVDELSPSQVEVQDYIMFDFEGETREGPVLDVEDNGATFTLTLSDEGEGDSVEYVVSADMNVSLMMYAAVAV